MCSRKLSRARGRLVRLASLRRGIVRSAKRQSIWIVTANKKNERKSRLVEREQTEASLRAL